MSECKYCHSEIRFRPFNEDGSPHGCAGMKKTLCKYCQKPIAWIKDGERWTPQDADGARHDCRSAT
jgi:hypothetical protein